YFYCIQRGWRRIRNVERMLPERTALEWRRSKAGDRTVRIAPYGDGVFKVIETGNTHVLFYEWSDGSFRDFEGGEREYLEWKANHWLSNPVDGYATFDAFLDAAKTDTTGSLRATPPSDDTVLEWTKAVAGESIVHHAVVPRRGAFEVRRPPKDHEYVLYFLPLQGAEQRIGAFGKSPTKAKEKAQDVALALVTGRGKTSRTQQLGDAELEWTDEPGERKVCIAIAPDGGEFQIIELQNGAFALYYLHTPENWDQLGCGECEQLKKRAATIAKSRRPATPKRRAKKNDDQAPKKSEDGPKQESTEKEKVKFAMGGLKSIIAEAISEAKAAE
ncbi:MAG: hypothetical protein KC468_14855, partial [Myxococcales bacterium]|nr:hypothetical protein [Myxococcales bacterium]